MEQLHRLQVHAKNVLFLPQSVPSSPHCSTPILSVVTVLCALPQVKNAIESLHRINAEFCAARMATPPAEHA
jgi:hypothetical protein